MNLNTRWRFKRIDLVGMAVIVAGAGLFYWLGISPIMSSRQRCLAQQAELDDQKSTVGKNEARLDEIKGRLAATRTAFDAVAVQLEPASALNSRISRLTALAAKNNLKIDEVRPSEPAYGKDYGSVPIVLGGTGNFASWAGFLHELSTTCPDTAIDTFLLTRKSAELTSPVQFSVNLIWYIAPLSPAAAGK